MTISDGSVQILPLYFPVDHRAADNESHFNSYNNSIEDKISEVTAQFPIFQPTPIPKVKLSASTDLSGLPSDLWLKIFKLILHSLHSLNACARVSKHFYRLIHTPNLYKEFFEQRPFGDHPEGKTAVIRTLAVRCYGVQTQLDLSHCLQLGDQDLVEVASCSPLLTRFKIGPFITRFDPNSTPGHVIGAIPDILAFSAHTINDMGVIALANSCSALRELSLTTCGRVTDISLTIIAEKMPSLRKLELLGLKNDDISDRGVKAILLGCRELEELRIEKFIQTNSGFISAEPFRGFTHLKLRKLYLEHAFSKDVLEDKDLMDVAQACENLTELHITNRGTVKLGYPGHNRLSESGLRQFAVACPNLDVLQVGGMHKLSENFLQELPILFPRMRSIDLSYSKVNDAIIKVLCQKWGSQLTEIHLQGCSIRDLACQSLAECNDLKFVSFKNTKRISAKGISLLANKFSTMTLDIRCQACPSSTGIQSKYPTIQIIPRYYGYLA